MPCGGEVGESREDSSGMSGVDSAHDAVVDAGGCFAGCESQHVYYIQDDCG